MQYTSIPHVTVGMEVGLWCRGEALSHVHQFPSAAVAHHQVLMLGAQESPLRNVGHHSVCWGESKDEGQSGISLSQANLHLCSTVPSMAETSDPSFSNCTFMLTWPFTCNPS